MSKRDWKTLDVAAWWKSHSLTIIRVSDGVWLGECPWQILHTTPESRCTLHEGERPKLSCNDEACKKRSFESLTKSLWQDGQLHCKRADAPEEPDDGVVDRLYPLGFTVKGEYYYQSGRTGHIRELSPSQHNELYCYSIIPNPKFWKEFSGSTEAISWKAVGRKMMKLCHQQGYYSKSETRGSGIFLDRKRIVVNLGAVLLVNDPGTNEFYPVNMADFKGDFIYAAPSRLTLPEPATPEDLAKILPMLEKMPFESPGGATILVGALVCGYMAGALKWRPHFWLTGKAASGKSEIMNLVLNALQPYPGGYFKGDTSAAGIRDAIKNSSMLIRVDELEKTTGVTDRLSGSATVRRADQIIEMSRSSSETSSAAVAKGDPHGEGFQSQIRFCAFLSSIYHGIESAQDYRRFCFIKLTDPATRPVGQSKEYADTIQSELTSLFDHEFAMKLYSWAVYNARYILDMVDHFISTMLTFSNNRGECDQWGTVMACAWCVTNYGKKPTAEDILTMFNMCYPSRDIDTVERTDLDHGSRAMNALMLSRPVAENTNIGEQIDSIMRGYNGEGAEAWLERYGIKVEKRREDHILVVHPNHIELGKIMQSAGYSTYKQVLMSYPKAKLVNREVTFTRGKARTVIEIPLEPVEKRDPPPRITSDEVARYGRQD